jgi:hypothetical protein
MTTRDRNLTKSLVCFRVSDLSTSPSVKTDHFFQARYLVWLSAHLYPLIRDTIFTLNRTGSRGVPRPANAAHRLKTGSSKLNAWTSVQFKADDDLKTYQSTEVAVQAQ